MIEENKTKPGYQTKLAKAAGCHPSFLSQVLNSHVHLTLDHAAGLARFWNLNDDELEYFLSLVTLERASTLELKKIALGRLHSLKQKNQDLAKDFDRPRIPDHQQEAHYYSSWLYPALHIAVSIPSMQNEAALIRRFQLSEEELSKAMATLLELGLVERVRPNKWRPTNKSIHLPRSSPFSRNNHINWRSKAISHMQNCSENGLHYTSVYALSKEDAKRLELLIRDCINETRRIVEPSREEDVVCFCCDLFRL